MNTARPFAILTAVLALVIGTPLLVVAAQGVEPELTGQRHDAISHDASPKDPPEDIRPALDAESMLIPFEVRRGEAGLSF